MNLSQRSEIVSVKRVVSWEVVAIAWIRDWDMKSLDVALSNPH